MQIECFAQPALPLPALSTRLKEIYVADDKSNRGEPDRSRISLSEPYELKYWANRFGVTVDEIKEAVHKVDSVPTQVEAWLQDN